MAGERREISIPVRPWFPDHRFGGRTILAAVEAMQTVAATVKAAHPSLDTRRMQAGRFAKLLGISPEATVLEAVVEMEQGENGGIRARLLTRSRGTVMTRLVTHCELTFAADTTLEAGMDNWPAEPCPDAAMVVSAEQVYRHLVPFGPAYRTLRDRLVLDEQSAWGTLLACEEVPAAAGPLGSPFPLDGAMHLACVHGQRLVDFVPFPVGFAAREIRSATRPGERYRTQARLRSRAKDELVYDLRICDQAEQVRELVSGLRMRDVSGGRIRPPAWIGSMRTGVGTEAEPLSTV